MPAANSPLIGYPSIFGDRKVIALDWNAPNPYVAGGVSFPAANLGWGGLDAGFGGVSQSGTYFSLIRFSADGSVRTAKVVVYVSATGAEAGAIDLSAEYFRLFFIGQ